MSYEVYICGNCLCPVWFPFGALQHVGTGWDCWNSQRSGEAPSIIELSAPIVPSSPTDVAEAVKGLRDLYETWRNQNQNERVFLSLAPLMNEGRTDIIERFLVSLAREEAVQPRAAFVRRLTTMPEWGAFVDRQPYRRRRPRRRARSRPTGRAATV